MRLALLIVIVVTHYVTDASAPAKRALTGVISDTSRFSTKFVKRSSESIWFPDEFQAYQTVFGGVNMFSPKLFKNVAGSSPKNLICAPISVYIVLSMVSSGARGYTKIQLRNVLGFSEEGPLPTREFQDLIGNLNKPRSVEMRFVNKIYIADNINIKCTFLNEISESFYSAVEPLNFYHSDSAAMTINDWVASQTNYRIKDLFKPGVITGDTKLVLVNAAYFEGAWKFPFIQDLTRDRPFYVGGTDMTKNIPTMGNQLFCDYGTLPHLLDAQFVGLEFNDSSHMENDRDSIKMYIILPNKRNGLPKLISYIEMNTNIVELLHAQSRTSTLVNLLLPKFNIESDIELTTPLIAMGLTGIFTKNANFGGIADERLSVGTVVQKAFIQVNEYGTKAGAATGSSVQNKDGNSKKFKADHPFLVIIANERVPLFMASFWGKE